MRAVAGRPGSVLDEREDQHDTAFLGRVAGVRGVSFLAYTSQSERRFYCLTVKTRATELFIFGFCLDFFFTWFSNCLRYYLFLSPCIV